MLLWGVWPPDREVATLHPISASEGFLRSDNSRVPVNDDLTRIVSNSTVVVLDYPTSVRVGDSEEVHLRVGFDAPEGRTFLTPLPQDASGGATETNRADPASWAVVVEALLDLPGARVRPNETISEALIPGQAAEFVWTVTVADGHQHRGTAWTRLLVNNKESWEQERSTISAQTLQIEGHTLLGVSGALARLIGGIGLAGGALFALPAFEATLRGLAQQPSDGA